MQIGSQLALRPDMRAYVYGGAGVTLCTFAYHQGDMPLAMGMMILAALVGLAEPDACNPRNNRSC